MPLFWKKPQRIFVNSMSDMFHDEIPVSFILKAFDTMRRASWHQFQILTKRSDRLLAVAPLIDWPENVWMGVSVENHEYQFRVGHLRKTGAAIKFLSLEPLLGPLRRLDLRGIDWVIVGGESGPGARPMESTWILEIKEQCERSGVPFFFKQWGGFKRKQAVCSWDARGTNSPLLANMHRSARRPATRMPVKFLQRPVSAGPAAVRASAWTSLLPSARRSRRSPGHWR